MNKKNTYKSIAQSKKNKETTSELNFNNILKEIRNNPSAPQKNYIDKFKSKENQAISASKISRFFRDSNIAQVDKIFICPQNNSTAKQFFFHVDDFKLQIKFSEFGNFIFKYIHSIGTISKSDYINLKGEPYSIYSFTLKFNNNVSSKFFKLLEPIENFFDFGIFSNSLGHKCIILNFKSSPKVKRFKKLLMNLKKNQHLEKTVFQCMNECNIKNIDI